MTVFGRIVFPFDPNAIVSHTDGWRKGIHRRCAPPHTHTHSSASFIFLLSWNLIDSSQFTSTWHWLLRAICTGNANKKYKQQKNDVYVPPNPIVLWRRVHSFFYDRFCILFVCGRTAMARMCMWERERNAVVCPIEEQKPVSEWFAVLFKLLRRQSFRQLLSYTMRLRCELSAGAPSSIFEYLRSKT